MASFGTCVRYVVVLAGLGLAPPAAAAPADAPAETGMVGGVPMMNAESLAKAEAEIGIRPDQKEAWTAYTDAVAGALENSESLHQSMTPKSISQLNPADRQALMTAMHEQRKDSLQQVAAARANLFAVLNDTQRAKARDLLGDAPRGMTGGGMMMTAPAK
jgi:hypothetical protein